VHQNVLHLEIVLKINLKEVKPRHIVDFKLVPEHFVLFGVVIIKIHVPNNKELSV
jgi:hypothetical protein